MTSTLLVPRPLRHNGGMELKLPDLAATIAFASRIAAIMQPGDAILLEGPLGAGKTEFARAVLRAATRTPALEVPSPTFTLVQSYDTPSGTVHHFDLWRLTGPDGLAELGWDDARDDIVLVEWPDRLAHLAPDRSLTIRLDPGIGESRIAHVDGWPDRLSP